MAIPHFNQPIGGFGSGRHRSSNSQVHGSAHQIASQAAQQRTLVAQQMAAWQNAFLTNAASSFVAGYAGCEPVEESAIEDTGIQVGEIIAWRAWRVERGWLYSVAMEGVEWEPGKVMESHKIGPVLGDGIHAFKTRKQALDYADGFSCMAIGRVALWGQVYEFEKGWHGEFAKVHSLDATYSANPPNPPRRRWFRKPEPPEPTLLQQLRQTYALSVPGV